MIAVVGHADLTPGTLDLVQTELRARMDGLADEVAGLVRIGAGLPVAFGRAVRAAGRRLVVLLPAQGTLPAVLPRPDRVAAGELLTLAEQVRLTAYDPSDRDACVSADEQMIASSRRLVAVWDGSPSNGRDATAHLVAYARAHGVDVEVVWPAGAARESGPGPQPRRDGKGGTPR